MNIKVPTPIIDKNKCIANILTMTAKARNNHVIFRPHFKTHQSAEIGKWFRNEGVNAITVSSVSMAAYFATHGWNDITIAITANILEIEGINRLARKIKLNLVVDHTDTLKALTDKITQPTGIFIKIDAGYHRTGIKHDDFRSIDELTNILKPSSLLKFRGFLTHGGNTYAASSKKEIRNIFNESTKKMLRLKNRYVSDFNDIIISAGDTPSCSIINNFKDIDEIRPGNFIFYDAMQYLNGICNKDQIAFSLACPVISKNDERHEIVIYGGAHPSIQRYYNR